MSFRVFNCILRLALSTSWIAGAISAPIVRTALGALSAWIAGLMFEDAIRSTMLQFGVTLYGAEIWHIGATLGFFSSYFGGIAYTKRGAS